MSKTRKKDYRWPSPLFYAVRVTETQRTNSMTIKRYSVTVQPSLEVVECFHLLHRQNCCGTMGVLCQNNAFVTYYLLSKYIHPQGLTNGSLLLWMQTRARSRSRYFHPYLSTKTRLAKKTLGFGDGCCNYRGAVSWDLLLSSGTNKTDRK